MSKRYSGKSFKDSSIKKKAKLSFKEKRKLKKEKQKKANQTFNLIKSSINISFFLSFKNYLNMYKNQIL